MTSRTSFHGDSLFDQTNRLATQSLSQHQFPTFGHKIEDPSGGGITPNPQSPPYKRVSDDLIKQRVDYDQQMKWRNHQNILAARMMGELARKMEEVKAKSDVVLSLPRFVSQF